MKCQTADCVAVGVQAGFCRACFSVHFGNARKFAQTARETGLTGYNPLEHFEGVEIWNVNDDTSAYGVCWVVVDRPEQPLNKRLVDFGVYRTPHPDAEKGTIQETAETYPLVKFEGHSVIDAMRTAFVFCHNDVRLTLCRTMPTYKKQLTQALKEAAEEVTPYTPSGITERVKKVGT